MNLQKKTLHCRQLNRDMHVGLIQNTSVMVFFGVKDIKVC